MIDHIGISVRDYDQSRAFYMKALAPLRIGIAMELKPEDTGGRRVAGMGADGIPFFWFSEGAAQEGLHLALSARDRKAVDAFHQAALEAGAKDNGAPGLRPHYHESYYAAFVIDPNGVNLEAVCHLPI